VKAKERARFDYLSLSALLYLKNLRRALWFKLPPHALDIAQHPERGDLVAAR
jgi:hypothetical protein